MIVEWCLIVSTKLKMKYNLSNKTQSGEALMYLADLIKEEKQVDIKVIKPRRSLNQNAYLHVLLGIFGITFGYTIEESKIIYKRLPGNKDIYIYKKAVGGQNLEFLRSSAELTKEEMMKTIDTLREWSAKLGLALPAADDQEQLRYYSNEIERQSAYL